jgi:hypothetical protein
MAHLPKSLWSKVLPDLRDQYHPTVSWLAVDGYGFDRAYFDTKRWVHEQWVPKPYAWQGRPEYFGRACDQGIGRALWFMNGANVPSVAAAVNAFASHRRADLWSGVGLAAAYAGTGDPEAFKALRDIAQEYRPEVAQGVVFAAKARVHAGLETPHTEVATQLVCDMSVADASEMTDEASSWFVGERGQLPDYELWRGRVQAHFR